MVFLVKNSTKKGAKIQNEYLFLLRCIMATSWIGNLYFSKFLGIICSLVKIRLTDLPKPGGNYLPYYHPSGGVPEVCPYVTKYVTWRNIHAFFGELPISVKGQIKSEWIYELIDFSNYQLKNFKDFCPKNLFEAHQWFAEKNKNKNSNIQHSLKVMGSNSIYLL